jgi:hypothetical protein
MADVDARFESAKKGLPSPSIDVVDLWKDSRKNNIGTIQQRSEGAGNQQRLTIGNEEYNSEQSARQEKPGVVKSPIKFELPKIGFELRK